MNAPRSISLLSTTASPTSLSPTTRPATAPGIPFFSRTAEMIFVTAIEHRGVVFEGFHKVAFPAARLKERFLYISKSNVNAFLFFLFEEKTLPPIYSNRKVESRENSNYTKWVWNLKNVFISVVRIDRFHRCVPSSIV